MEDIPENRSALYEELLASIEERIRPSRYKLWEYRGEARELLLKAEEVLDDDWFPPAPYLWLRFMGMRYMRLPTSWQYVRFNCVRPAHKQQWLAELPIAKETAPLPEIFHFQIAGMEYLLVCDTLQVLETATLYPLKEFSPIEQPLSRDELIALVEKIKDPRHNDEDICVWLALLNHHVPHPAVSDLIFWSNRCGLGDDPTSAEIIDMALAYQPKPPIVLPPPAQEP